MRRAQRVDLVTAALTRRRPCSPAPAGPPSRLFPTPFLPTCPTRFHIALTCLQHNHAERNMSNSVESATVAGLKAGAAALACSSTVILGACKLFPAFNRSLSVSGKTALIVTPAFGAFFLIAELAMVEAKRAKRSAL